MRKSNIISLAIVVASFIVAGYFYPQLPEKVASHWNAQGNVDGYLPKFWGAFLMPIISVVMYLLFLIIPAIDPKKQNIEKFRKYFDWFIVLMLLFLFYLYALTLAWSLNYRFNLIQLLSPAFALLFYYSGVLINHAEPNWTIGIRTPWTLSNETVWKKTHILGGKLFKTTGSISLLGIFWPDYAIGLIIIPSITAALVSIIYSYLKFRKLPR